MSGCAFNIEYDKACKVLDENCEKVIGEILTTIEAVLPPGKQAESAKSLIKQTLWRFNRGVKSGLEVNKKMEEK